MKILQLCNKPPFPPMDGGAIGMNNVTMGLLHAGHQVKVLSVNTHKHFVDENTLPADYKSQTEIELLFVDTRLKALDAFLNLFGRRSYHITRFYDKALARRLEVVLQQHDFDIVQVESVFLKDYLPLIRKNSKAKLVLRAPNVEYKIWERLAGEKSNPLKKWYLNILYRRLKREELEALNHFDALYTVTLNDLEIFKTHGLHIPATFIPTGPDVMKTVPAAPLDEEYPSLFHLGALDWMPNQEGLVWFLQEVWPSVLERFPHTRFYIAGRRPSETMRRIQGRNVHMLGEIDDAARFMHEHTIMVVPLFSGSGMRVKIVEGMMAGKVVVSTSIGAEGIEVKSGRDLFIADNSRDFIEVLSKLLGNKNLRQEIARQAVSTCRQYYSEEALTNKLLAFFQTLLP